MGSLLHARFFSPSFAFAICALLAPLPAAQAVRQNAPLRRFETGGVFDARTSPDGTRYVYRATEGVQAPGLFSVRIDGSERKRLLPAARRTGGGYRVYGEDDANRVRFIRRAQSMGLTLEDVGELLRAQTLRTAEQCRRVAARLKARIQTVDEKVAELRAFRAELARHLRQCERAGAEPDCCPVVLELAADGRAKKARR